jgi:hypothetical protein
VAWVVLAATVAPWGGLVPAAGRSREPMVCERGHTAPRAAGSNSIARQASELDGRFDRQPTGGLGGGIVGTFPLLEAVGHGPRPDTSVATLGRRNPHAYLVAARAAAWAHPAAQLDPRRVPGQPGTRLSAPHRVCIRRCCKRSSVKNAPQPHAGNTGLVSDTRWICSAGNGRWLGGGHGGVRSAADADHDGLLSRAISVKIPARNAGSGSVKASSPYPPSRPPQAAANIAPWLRPLADHDYRLLTITRLYRSTFSARYMVRHLTSVDLKDPVQQQFSERQMIIYMSRKTHGSSD